MKDRRTNLAAISIGASMILAGLAAPDLLWFLCQTDFASRMTPWP
jgi:hypothetical protein